MKTHLKLICALSVLVLSFAGARPALATWRGYNGDACQQNADGGFNYTGDGAIAGLLSDGSNALCPLMVISSAGSTSAFTVNAYVLDQNGSNNVGCYITSRYYSDTDGTYYTTATQSSSGNSSTAKTLAFSVSSTGSFYLATLYCNIFSNTRLLNYWVDEAG